MNLCAQVEQRLDALVESVSLDDGLQQLRAHLETCSGCAALVEDAEILAEGAASLGAGFELSDALVERVMARARQAGRARRRREAAARRPAAWRMVLSRVWGSVPLRLALVGACVVLSFWTLRPAGDGPTAPGLGGLATLHVRQAEGLGPDAARLEVGTADGRWLPLHLPGDLPPGARLRTGHQTRSTLVLPDGSRVALNRATEITWLGDGLRLTRGELLAEVRPRRSPLVLTTATARVEVLGTKFNLAADDQLTLVDVARGLVRLHGGQGEPALVRAGQEGAAPRGRRPAVALASDLGRTLAWAEADDTDEDPQPMGLGSLTARRPGRSEQLPLRLEDHRVSVRIQGAMARTEITEVFANDGPHTLEGIYRFPLPAGARISRLALEVDGRLEEGTIVERDRAEKIWRGVLRQATPKRLRKKEEYIWVPGPWKDPALLQWREGNQFELRIFPIPARGTRRVILAYTETLPRTALGRRYVYPLPDGGDDVRCGRFAVDLGLEGHDRELPVRTPVYAMARAVSAGAQRLRFAADDFIPAGDLVVDFATPEVSAPLSVYTYAGDGADEPGYALFALRPELPPYRSQRPLAVALIVDRSYSTLGEVGRRQLRLLRALVDELGQRHRVAVAVCDTHCRTVSGWGTPSDGIAEAVARVRPGGATNLGEALRHAGELLGRTPAGHRPRAIYLGDGIATVGELELSRLRHLARQHVAGQGARLTTVGVGTTVDAQVLGALAQQAGGRLVPYLPGTTARGQALTVLARQAGVVLEEVELELPPGVQQAAPSRLRVLHEGEELLLVGRVRGAVQGELRLRGRVNGEPFAARYRVDAPLQRGAGNAFIPRLWGQLRVADLASEDDSGNRAEIVALSQRHHLLTRHTSLLVLESEAMRRAFDVGRGVLAPHWTGEAAARAATDSTERTAEEEGEAEDDHGGRREAIGGRLALSTLGSGRVRGRVASRGLRAGGLQRRVPTGRKRDSLDDLIDGALGGGRQTGSSTSTGTTAGAQLSRSQVQAAMRAIKARVFDCFSRHGVSGLANVFMVIFPDGRPRRVRVKGALAGTPAASCIERVARGAVFPRFAGPQLSITYPFVDNGGSVPDRLPATRRAMPARVSGSLSRDVIQRVIQRQLPAIQAVYERALQRDASLQGRISLRFTIGADGAVHRVSVQGGGVGDQVERELVRAVGRWRFPRPSGGGSVEVVYPLVFRTIGDGGAVGGSERRSPAPTRTPTPTRRRRWTRMKRVWEQRATIRPLAGATAADLRRVQRRRRELAASPDSRDRHQRLFAALSRAGMVAEAARVIADWLEREPLSVEAVTFAAEVAARDGRRDEALRWLGSLVELEARDAALHRRLAVVMDSAGDRDGACAHWISLSTLRQDEASAGRAAACRAGGDPQAPDTRQQSRVRVDGRWSTPLDLDLALVDARGRRWAWLGSRSGVVGRRVRDERGEGLEIRRLPPGRYRIEVSRAQEDGEEPVDGQLTVRAPGAVRRLSFALLGQRTTAGELRITRQSRLVPAP